jgi:hypothetical protein
VRNENRARRRLAKKGRFDVSAAGCTVQSLCTFRAKVCKDKMWDHYFAKLKKPSDFTAHYVIQRNALFSTSFLLDTIYTGKETILTFRSNNSSLRLTKVSKVTSNTAEQSNSNRGINKYRDMPILEMINGIATTMAKQH